MENNAGGKVLNAETVVGIVSIVVTIISIIVTTISIVQSHREHKHQKSNRTPPR